MIATNSGSRILVLAAVGAALVGCDSIKDVRSEPATELPPQTVVLKGTASGLSSKRPVFLVNNDQLSLGVSVAAPPPAESNEELEGVTPFAMGPFPVGTPYNLVIYNNPLGKNCTVVSGGSGTFTAGVETNAVVDCVDVGTRYSVTASLDPAFASAEGAEVVLTTEERIYRIKPAPTDTSVTFSGVLFNPVGSSQGFNWSVVASNTIGGTLNKCPVANSTNVKITPGAFSFLPPTIVITNPTADVTNVAVGACEFQIGGSVAYSPRTLGGAAPATPPAGLVLELRDIGQNLVRTQAFSGTWGDAFTFEENGAPVNFVSNRNAIYSVAVNTHPDGMRCVVVNPMGILYSPTLDSNPTSVSTPSVQCREVPTADRQLAGVYRHKTSIFKRNPSTAEQVVTYDALDFTKQNTASSNMIALFDNGTYLYGTHANRVQVEHGFYDYDPVAGTLTFTLNADTEPGLDFPAAFNPANGTSAAALTTTTPGMSALPGRVLSGPVARYVTMQNVDTGTPGVISGTFLGAQTQVTGSGPGTVRVVEPNASMGWVLEAPPSIPMQMTGGWLEQNGRRLWVFDRETYYGTHVGVAGVYAMNDACFTMPDVSVSSGLYTRRPSIGGCYPWPRAATGQSPAYLLSGLVESVDFKFPQYIPTNATGTAGGAVDIGTLPTYMARIPGGAQAVDGRSPSPIYFHIAPAAEFYDDADTTYFPEQATSWCDTEILGIRATLNAVPIHQPVYFCRFVP